jgi:protein-tyrosine phosphatase
MTRILMVCLGNICRSPIADGLLQKKVKESNLDIYVDSAGTSAHHTGEAPDQRMQRVALSRGTNLSNLKARQLTYNDFEKFDVIYAMDNENLKNILALAKNDNDKQKVRLFLNELHPQQNLNVPDPYFGGNKGFEEVYDMVDATTDEIIRKFKLQIL